MSIYKKRMNTFFKRILTEEAEVIELFPGQEQADRDGTDYSDYASDTPEQTNMHFISELYDAVVKGTGTTGFGFLFEKIIVDNANLVGLADPKPLNLPGAAGETNTAFADIIADGDIYYSVKCSIWDGGTPEERNITEVNASKSSSIIKLAESLVPKTHNWDAGDSFNMKCGVITGHPSGDETAKENFLKLGYVVEILGPSQENIKIRKDQDTGELIAVMLDSSGNEVQQSRKPSKKEREEGIEDNILYYGIKEKPTSASAFQTKLFHPSIEQTSSSKTTTLRISPFRSDESDPMLVDKVPEVLYAITVASGISAAKRATTGTKEISAADAKAEIGRLGALGPEEIEASQQGLNTKASRIMMGVARAKRIYAEVKKLMYEQSHKFAPGKAEKMHDSAMAFQSIASKPVTNHEQQAAAATQLYGTLTPEAMAIFLANIGVKPIPAGDPAGLTLVKENISNINDLAILLPAIAKRIYNLLDAATPENGDDIADYIIEKLQDATQKLSALDQPQEKVAEAVITLKRLLELAGLDKK